jgi:hypothetical protein
MQMVVSNFACGNDEKDFRNLWHCEAIAQESVATFFIILAACERRLLICTRRVKRSLPGRRKNERPFH